MKPTTDTLHGLLFGSHKDRNLQAPDDEHGEDGPQREKEDPVQARHKTVNELIEHIKSGNAEGADEALHSYYTQMQAEEPEEDSYEPEDMEEDESKEYGDEES